MLIMIFDEVISLLDSMLECVILVVFCDVVKGYISLVIVYRLFIIVDVDKIFVFKNGIIVEEGIYIYLFE